MTPQWHINHINRIIQRTARKRQRANDRAVRQMKKTERQAGDTLEKVERKLMRLCRKYPHNKTFHMLLQATRDELM